MNTKTLPRITTSYVLSLNPCGNWPEERISSVLGSKGLTLYSFLMSKKIRLLDKAFVLDFWSGGYFHDFAPGLARHVRKAMHVRHVISRPDLNERDLWGLVYHVIDWTPYSAPNQLIECRFICNLIKEWNPSL